MRLFCFSCLFWDGKDIEWKTVGMIRAKTVLHLSRWFEIRSNVCLCGHEMRKEEEHVTKIRYLWIFKWVQEQTEKEILIYVNGLCGEICAWLEGGWLDDERQGRMVEEILLRQPHILGTGQEDDNVHVYFHYTFRSIIVLYWELRVRIPNAEILVGP